MTRLRPRALARGLSPVALEGGGLVDSLRTLLDRAREMYGLDIRLRSRLAAPVTLQRDTRRRASSSCGLPRSRVGSRRPAPTTAAAASPLWVSGWGSRSCDIERICSAARCTPNGRRRAWHTDFVLGAAADQRGHRAAEPCLKPQTQGVSAAGLLGRSRRSSAERSRPPDRPRVHRIIASRSVPGRLIPVKRADE